MLSELSHTGSENKFLVEQFMQYRKTHPNLCKLWLDHLHGWRENPNNMESNVSDEALKVINNMQTIPDFTKFNIIAIYCLLYV